MRIAVLLMVACGGGSGDPTTDTDTDGTPPTPGPEPSSTLVLTDATNYALDATLNTAHTSAMAGADITVDWSGLDTDLLGRPMDPTGVYQVWLVSTPWTPAELAEQLVEDQVSALNLDDNVWYLDPAGATSAPTSAWSQTGHPFSPGYWSQPEQTTTFGLLFVDADQKLLAAATFAPDGAETTLSVGPSPLAYTATLSGATLPTTPELGPWTIEWDRATKSVHGWPHRLEQLFVAHVPGDTAAVEAAALDLQSAADQWFVRYVEGKTTLGTDELSSLDGSTFDGFTADGTWVVGLQCLSCLGVPPHVIGQVEVLAAGP